MSEPSLLAHAATHVAAGTPGAVDSRIDTHPGSERPDREVLHHVRIHHGAVREPVALPDERPSRPGRLRTGEAEQLPDPLLARTQRPDGAGAEARPPTPRRVQLQ